MLQGPQPPLQPGATVRPRVLPQVRVKAAVRARQRPAFISMSRVGFLAFADLC